MWGKANVGVVLQDSVPGGRRVLEEEKISLPLILCVNCLPFITEVVETRVETKLDRFIWPMNLEALYRC